MSICKNIPSLSSFSVLFSFENQDMIIGDVSHIITNGTNANIEILSTNDKKSEINSLPTSFRALDSSSNISITVPIEVKRDESANYEFYMKAGNMLSYESSCSCISLYGSSLNGASINLKTSNIAWDTTSCTIDTNSIDGNASDSDIIWLHPVCDGVAACNMNIGQISGYSLINAEINRAYLLLTLLLILVLPQFMLLVLINQ